jgi:hypothetical protein
MNDLPAFPTWNVIDIKQGMTLRDYFAAAALTGLLRESEDNDVAKLAYQFADAMMEARK